MNWTIIRYCLFVMLGLTSFCMGAESDFRNTRWGMSKIEVMASEDLKPESFTGPYITYRTVMLGKEMYLIYEFIQNRLILW